MTYRTDKMLLETTQELYRGRANDVIVCRDMSADILTYYTLLVIKDGEIAKRFLAIYEGAKETWKKKVITTFTHKDDFIVVFAYERERPIEKFFYADISKLPECEQLCMNIVLECMSSGIPYPIMYLQTVQSQIHIRKDRSIAFGYGLNLEKLDPSKGEKECVGECAKLCFKLLERVASVKTATYKLLRLKNEKGGYKRFTELFKDLKAAAVPLEKDSIKDKAVSKAALFKDNLFKILLGVCIVLVIMALIMLITQMIFGDLPFMRVFVNSFKQIGTESMLQ